MWVFKTYIGAFVIQSVLHAVIAVVVIEISIRVWDIRLHRDMFRYRLQAILLPFFMFPVFQLLNPQRGSFYFIEDNALLSSTRWFDIELFGLVPVWIVVVVLLSAVSLVSIFQEMAPVAMDFIPRKRETDEGAEVALLPEVDGIVERMSAELGIKKPVVRVVEDDPIIFTLGTKNPHIIISDELLGMLGDRELEGALAHELAHIARRSNFTTMLVFILRSIMFYNPVSLLVFRRLVQDDEHICDDITVDVTQDPGSLAAALRHFYYEPQEGDTHGLSDIKKVLETSSHNLLLKERITRLEAMDEFIREGFGWARFVLTMSVIVAISYYVV